MSKSKSLTKEKYLSKFSRAVRWRLPPQEAEDAISDYRELIFHAERDETKLVEELGEPVQAAHLLTDVKTYRRWLWVFGILAFGLFLMAKWCWTGQSFLYFAWDYSLYSEGWRGILVLLVGMVLSLVWFRRNGQKSGALSKWLLLSLAAAVIFGVIVLWMSWQVFDPKFLAKYAELDYDTLIKTSLAQRIILYRGLIIDGGTVCSFVALAGLLLARMKDRRWLALYTLALTAAVLCYILECWMLSINISVDSVESIVDARLYLFPRLIPVGIAGLVGTGVALC